MKVPVAIDRSVPHHPEIAWDALLDPRADYYGGLVNVQHTGLSRTRTIQRGSKVQLQPAAAVKKRIPWVVRGMIQPVGLVVAELNPRTFSRQDTVLPNAWVEGGITRLVEEDDQGGTIIAVEAELAVNSLLDALAGRLPVGTTPHSYATECLEGMLTNWATLAGELASARNT